MATAGVSTRRKKARRAGVAVLSGLAAFAVLQLTLGLAAETILQGWHDPLYGRRLHLIQTRLESGPDKPRIVVMVGSSLTLFGFQAGLSEKTLGENLGRPVTSFNFGVAGGGPLTELLTWRRLHRDGVRPALLLIEVRPPCLDSKFLQSECREDFLPADHLSRRELSLVARYAGGVRRGLGRDRLNTLLAPLYAHRLSILRCVAPFLLPGVQPDVYSSMDQSGGLRIAGGPIPLALRLQGARSMWEYYQSQFTAFRLRGPGCEELRELLASCRREGVPAVIVLMPEGPVFRSWYTPEAWRAIQDWLDLISREYGAALVNAREWIDDEEDFTDSHHLRGAGADKFTERLGREYLLPLLRRGEESVSPKSVLTQAGAP